MDEIEQLSPVQIEALCSLAAGRSIKETAEITGVTQRTIDRWKQLPNFKKLLQDAVIQTYNFAISELCLGAKESAIKLREIINNEETPVRLKIKAIEILLLNASKAKEAILEYRLEKVEKLLEDVNTIEITPN